MSHVNKRHLLFDFMILFAHRQTNKPPISVSAYFSNTKFYHGVLESSDMMLENIFVGPKSEFRTWSLCYSLRSFVMMQTFDVTAVDGTPGSADVRTNTFQPKLPTNLLQTKWINNVCESKEQTYISIINDAALLFEAYIYDSYIGRVSFLNAVSYNPAFTSWSR